ncbi:hypothetical protein [Amycolatopsis sp. NPDC021455]|uniref:hypothetical protein n=1 Tax=Amycolatopsis sp. NPDC021455 TaxID=3154901 RepID=UPI0033E93EA4
MQGAHVWTLEDITFHYSPDIRDAQGVQWILTKEEGFWGTPATNANLTPRLNRHGAYRSPGWKKERIVTLTGRMYAENYTTLRQAETNLLGVLSDPTAPGKLTCYSELGPMSLDVFLDDAILCTPLDVVSEPGIEFSIQLVAPDPRKYGNDLQIQTVGLPQDSGDGLDYTAVVAPDTEPGLYFGSGAPDDGLQFGTFSGSGFITLSNAGTAPASPVYAFYGPLNVPVLTTNTGFSMQYNDSLAAGASIVVDPSAPSVLYNGEYSVRAAMYPTHFDEFFIPPARGGVPGELTVSLAHSGSSNAGGYVQVSYRTSWF